MITTLEDFRNAAIELCDKYGLSKSFHLSVAREKFIGDGKKEFTFTHKEIEEGTPFKGRIPEDILSVAESCISKIKYSSFF